MTRDVMIDIETLGTGYRALVTSIGAVEFHLATGELGREFKINIDPGMAQKRGFQIDADTVLWWFTQPQEAQQAMIKNAKPPTWAFGELHTWLCGTKVEIDQNFNVWANGSNFDIRILDEGFDLLKFDKPWRFRNVRDVRTFTDIYERWSGGSARSLEVEPAAVEHDALEDAKFQVRVMIKMWEDMWA